MEKSDQRNQLQKSRMPLGNRRTLRYIFIVMASENLDYYIHKTRAGCVEKHMKREHLRSLKLIPVLRDSQASQATLVIKEPACSCRRQKKVQAPSLG